MQARTYHFSPAVNSSFGSLLFGSKPATTDLTASNLRHAHCIAVRHRGGKPCFGAEFYRRETGLGTVAALFTAFCSQLRLFSSVHHCNQIDH